MNIIVVGAGKGGTNIIESFSKIPDIRIKQLISKSSDAPGVALARTLGIRYSSSIEEIACDNVDLIIEATGSSDVARELNEKFGSRCTVIDSKGAYLIMTLANKDINNNNQLDSHFNSIRSTSEVIQNNLDFIASSIDGTHEISKKLIDFTNTSIKHIEESDKIIQYVNNISKQIKILGINATIEAARAGEHGRGFAVVANEVQNLANSSENSAKEINKILEKLSGEIKSIKNDVDKLNELSKSQVEASSNANEAVNKLVNSVN